MCDVTYFLFFYHKHETDIGSDVSLNRMQFCILTEDVTLVTQSSPHTYIHTYIHTCIHTYMHTYMHTYITCMHALIHTNILLCVSLRLTQTPYAYLTLCSRTRGSKPCFPTYSFSGV